MTDPSHQNPVVGDGASLKREPAVRPETQPNGIEATRQVAAGVTQPDATGDTTRFGKVDPQQSSPATPQAAGSTIGPYELLSKLGEGGMGAVWKARHSHLDRVVAVKLLTPKLVGNSDAVARFHREMKLTARVMHPHVVTAFDAGASDGVHYLAMEFVDGADLHALVKQRGPLEPTQAARVIRQAALGLAAAHDHGLVHRDVKPQNLLLSNAGQVKLLDLGLARLAEAAETEASVSGLTGASQIMGTPDYMAPEQWEDTHSVGPAADLYALGCTLFFLLTGRPPFDSKSHPTAVRKMAAHITEPPPDLATACPAAPPGLVGIYNRLMRKSPADRFSSASELAEQLQPFTRKKDSGKTHPEGETVRPAGETLPEVREREPSLADFLASVGDLAATAVLPKPSAANVPPKRPRKRLLLSGGAFGAFLLFGIIVIITSRDGQETKIELPEGSTVRVERQPRMNVRVPGSDTPKETLPNFGISYSDQGSSPVVPLPLRMDQPFTLEAFVKPAEKNVIDGKDGRTFCSVGPDDQFQMRIIPGENGERWQVRCWGDWVEGRDTGAYVHSDKRMQSDRWTHVAVVWDGQRLTLFVDGRKQSDVKPMSQHPLKAIHRTDYKSFFHLNGFPGALDEICISDFARYGANFTPTLRQVPDEHTLLLWHCDEGEGQIIRDSSGHNRDLILPGVEWIPAGVRPQTSVRQSASITKVTKPLAGPRVGPLGWLPGPLETALPGIVARPAVLPNVGRWQVRPVTESGPTTIAYSPDGRRVALGSRLQPEVWIHDAESFRPLQVFRGGGLRVKAIAWHPHAAWLASVASDKRIRLWNLETGTAGAVFSDSGVVVNALAWSPDGRHLAAGAQDGTVRLWNLDGTAATEPWKIGGAVSCMDWSSDSARLAVGSTEGVSIWNRENASLISRYEGLTQVRHVVFADDGGTIAAAGITAEGSGAAIWDAASGKAQNSFAVEPFIWAGWSPGLKTLAVYGRETMHSYDAATGQMRTAVIPMETRPDSMKGCWHPDGTGVLVADQYRGLVLWENLQGLPDFRTIAAPVENMAVCWSPDGSRLAAGDFSRAVHVWHADGRDYGILWGTAGHTKALAWSPDGSALAVGSYNGILLHPMDDMGKDVVQVETADTETISWRPDGQWLANGGASGAVRLRSRIGETGPVFEGHGGSLRCVAWSPDGQRIVSGGADSTLRFWNPEGGAEKVETLPAPVNSVAWSPDGAQLVAGLHHDRQNQLLLDSEGQVQQTLPSHGWETRSVAWSPSGEWFASAGGLENEPRIMLFRSDGAAGPVIPGGFERSNGFAWRPGGMELAAGGRDGVIRIRTADGEDARTIFRLPFADIRRRILGRMKIGELIRAAAWSPDGTRLITRNPTDLLQLWQADGTAGPELPKAARTIWSAVWSPDSARFATRELDGLIRLWQADGTAGPVLAKSAGSLTGVSTETIGTAWAADGRIAACLADGSVCIWNSDGTVGPILRGHGERVMRLAFASDGRLAGAEAEGKIHFWDRGGHLLKSVQGHDLRVSTIAWSPDSQFLATGDSTGIVRLWEADGTLRRKFSGHSGRIYDVIWSPDSHRFATRSGDRQVRIEETDGSAVILMNTGGVLPKALTWTENGQRLKAVDEMGVIHTWDQPLQKQTATSATYSVAGELLQGDPQAIERSLVYLLEEPDGRTSLLTPSGFYRRLGIEFPGTAARD